MEKSIYNLWFNEWTIFFVPQFLFDTILDIQGSRNNTLYVGINTLYAYYDACRVQDRASVYARGGDECVHVGRFNRKCGCTRAVCSCILQWCNSGHWLIDRNTSAMGKNGEKSPVRRCRLYVFGCPEICRSPICVQQYFVRLLALATARKVNELRWDSKGLDGFCTRWLIWYKFVCLTND